MIKKEWINILVLVLFLACALYFNTIVKTNASGLAITSYDDAGNAATAAPKYLTVFLLPLAAILLYVLILIVSRISVYRIHLDRFFEKFFSFKLIIILLFFAIYVSRMLANQNLSDYEAYVLIPLLAIGFWYISHLFDHAKSNYFTPWIKGRSKMWEDTHHIGTWLFRACAIIVLLALVWPPLLTVCIAIPLFCIFIMIIVYSYLIFKNEHHIK